MKHIFIPFFLAAVFFGSCATTVPQTRAAQFSDLMGKTWVLIEVQSGGTVKALDRGQLASDGMLDAYTLRFIDSSADRISGKGAPNTYNGGYIRGEGQTIRFSSMVSTKMAAFKEPEVLKENEYLSFLEKVYRWDIIDGLLNLVAKDDTETVLVYSEVKNPN
jgi:heat shock protein HslJ